MRIRLDSVGCRLNIGEIEAMARGLSAAGHLIVAPGEPADLCVLNTCTVTATAARKSRQSIRQLRRSNPDARMVATGCLAELEAESIEDLGVDLIIGNEDKDDLPEILTRHGLLQPAEGSSEPTGITPGNRTRAFLKVQDGCDNRCAFCVVTVARGPGRSTDGDRIVAEVRNLRSLGYREVVLSGVHLGSFGLDFGRPRGLEELVRRILAETDLPRLRLSSLEPWDLSPGFFDLFGDSRLLPHLHLPLQSGCNATLRRMARKTTAEDFSSLVATARRTIGDVSISTDIMAGFPGETDEEFEETMAAVEKLAFSRLHVFRYSRREGTPAATLPNPVPGPVIQERSRRLHELGQQLMTDFHAKFIGRRMTVLWEGAEEWGDVRRWSGLTGNYIRVLTETGSAADLANQVAEVEIEACIPGGVIGAVPGVSTSGIESESRRRVGPLTVIPIRDS
jgi:threonylcarbamoyladenosine tRNA methylthiotransferase MtaB